MSCWPTSEHVLSVVCLGHDSLAGRALHGAVLRGQVALQVALVWKPEVTQLAPELLASVGLDVKLVAGQCLVGFAAHVAGIGCELGPL